MRNKRFIRATAFAVRFLPTTAYCMHKGLQHKQARQCAHQQQPIADRVYQTRETTYASLPFLVNKAAPSVCEHLPSRRGKRLRLSAGRGGFLKSSTATKRRLGRRWRSRRHRPRHTETITWQYCSCRSWCQKRQPACSPCPAPPSPTALRRPCSPQDRHRKARMKAHLLNVPSEVPTCFQAPMRRILIWAFSECSARVIWRTRGLLRVPLDQDGAVRQ